MAKKMKKRKKWPWIVLAILGLLVALAAWFMRPPANTIPSVTDGRLERFPQFTSQHVPPRDVVVWLPTGKGWDKGHFSTQVYPGHSHSETSWAQRLDQPLLFMLGR